MIDLCAHLSRKKIRMPEIPQGNHREVLSRSDVTNQHLYIDRFASVYRPATRKGITDGLINRSWLCNIGSDKKGANRGSSTIRTDQHRASNFSIVVEDSIHP